MDSTVIQEIADQLGMAVDQTGQFIAEHLPEYAALKCMQSSLTIWECVITLLFIFIPFAISATIFCKALKNDGFHHEPDEFISFWVTLFVGIVFAFAFICALILISFELPEVIGWSQYPEAMLIDKAISAIG